VQAYIWVELDPHHKIYMTDINENGETEYWILHLALNGLQKAGHGWYKKLRVMFEEGGYLKQCAGDEGTYT
jgi:hypothetical protein